MVISYDKKLPRKFVIVVHVNGTADQDDDARPLVSVHSYPKHVYVINLNNKNLVIESAPTLAGPWVVTDTIKKNKSQEVIIHNLYTRAKTKMNDTLNFWVTVFKT